MLRAVFSATRPGTVPARAPGLQREDVGPGGAFEIIHAHDGLGHGFADEENAVVAHDHGADRRVLEQARAACALVLEREAAVILIDDLAVVEHGRGLVDRGKAAFGEAGEHRGIGRVHMHGAACMGDVAMKAGMQAPGCRIGCVLALCAVGVPGVDHPEVGGPDPAEMPFRIDQEFGSVVVHCKREVVGHAFVHVFAGRQPERGGKLGAGLGMGHLGRPLQLSQCRRDAGVARSLSTR
jgi:hypothetical protein